MSSIREQILEAALLALNTGTPVGVPQTVRSRRYALTAADLPAMSLFWRQPELVRTVDPAGPLLRRRLRLTVECHARGTALEPADSLVDPMTVWAVKALCTGVLGAGGQLGGLVNRLTEITVDLDGEVSDEEYALARVELLADYDESGLEAPPPPVEPGLFTTVFRPNSLSGDIAYDSGLGFRARYGRGVSRTTADIIVTSRSNETDLDPWVPDSRVSIVAAARWIGAPAGAFNYRARSMWRFVLRSQLIDAGSLVSGLAPPVSWWPFVTAARLKWRNGDPGGLQTVPTTITESDLRIRVGRGLYTPLGASEEPFGATGTECGASFAAAVTFGILEAVLPWSSWAQPNRSDKVLALSPAAIDGFLKTVTGPTNDFLDFSFQLDQEGVDGVNINRQLAAWEPFPPTLEIDFAARVASIREQIIAAAVAALNTGAPAGVPPTLRSRRFAFGASELPAMSLWWRQPEEMQTVDPAGPLIRRRLRLIVECHEKGTATDPADKLVDPMTVWVVKALCTGPLGAGGILGGLANRIVEAAVDLDVTVSDNEYALARVVLLVDYQTRVGDPEQKV